MIPVAGTKPVEIFTGHDVAETNSLIVSGGGGSNDWRKRVREIVFPVWDDGQGLYVFDNDGKMVLQIRGWGGLTSSKIPDNEAADIQADWGKYIATAMNEYAKTEGLWDGVEKEKV